jgi:ribonuclease Z
MKIRFLGVGEAWDAKYNTSSILVDDGKTVLMVDCGFKANQPMASIMEDEKKDFNYLDGIYITHCHSDHQTGILGLLAIMSSFDHNPHLEPRKKSISIMGPEGTERSVRNFIEERHPGLFRKFGYDVIFQEVKPGDEKQFKTLKLNFARTEHGSVPSIGIRISSDGKSVAYSGDGALTEESKNMYDGVDLLVHEAYALTPQSLHHGTIPNLLDMMKEIKIGKLALVHMNRYERLENMDEIKRLISSKGFKYGENVLIPEDGYEMEI